MLKVDVDVVLVVFIFLVLFEVWCEIYIVKFEILRWVLNVFNFFLLFNVRFVKCYLIY